MSAEAAGMVRAEVRQSLLSAGNAASRTLLQHETIGGLACAQKQCPVLAPLRRAELHRQCPLMEGKADALIGSDPVAISRVASFSRPGNNVTGVAMLQTAVTTKRVELLHELVPTATSIGILVNSDNPDFAAADAKEAQQAARSFGVILLAPNANNPSEIDAAFATLVQQQAGALVIGADIFYISRTDQLVALAARHAVPTIYAYLEQGAAGALICYGASLAATQRTVGVYTRRILKGEKPADLPVQQVTKLQLVINIKTAKALGLPFSPSLLARADEVIE